MRCFVAFAVLLILSAAVGSVAAESHPVMAAIDAAQSAGDLSAGQAALYKVLYITGAAEKIPAEFRNIEGGEMRCATPILMEIDRQMPNFPQDLRDAIMNARSRPTVCPEYVDTAHFRIHYAITGTHMIYLWPNTTYLDGVTQACENSYAHYHGGVQHWDTPPSDASAGGGMGLIDCYVMDVGTGIYGYCEPEGSPSGGAPWDRTAFFVIDHDYTGFGYTDRLDPAKVTIAHEYHHAVQFGYTAAGGSWWMENTSTWQEDNVYDDINDNYSYLGCFFASPHLRLMDFNGCHEYGLFVWPEFMSLYYNDMDVVEEIWQRLKWDSSDELGEMENEFAERGSSLDDTFVKFGEWNYFTSVRDDGDHYTEGANYTQVAYTRSYSSYPQVGIHPQSVQMPDRLGTSYMRWIRDTGSSHNLLRVTLDGPETVAGFAVIAKEATGTESHVYPGIVDEFGDCVVEVPNWDQMVYAYSIVSIQNLSYDDQDYAISVETDNQSTAVGESETRVVMTAKNAPNPFYPATTIHYTLSQPSDVRVRIVDASGRLIQTLVNRHEEAGRHEILWTGNNASGEAVRPGIYFYQVQTDREELSKKMLMLR
ncbi:MAG: T9SS type A sorting domain-containing protein [Candidatus Eisenbacteria bacterium]|uniref:T9SS type A sorting domain-containing protein n=1 Tax=Eiseniibacteriota bacterium TaxID=2212470 RepID=A0A948W5R8_UNCEI|nr:T9SS type A sorting domain-containing protein [Candidatus Eisenbacteria bacterium]MBU1949435.1 T9SS type A sorting domain-containing protein [Candidatus Eisenbacteria bacterium]MBU2690310.1 T9SS type A sorting domain-containing protein [Candidatus Eisenbacteria bacterium]